MAEIAANPGFITGALTLEGDGFTKHIEKATLKPSNKNERFQDISGAFVIRGGLSEWALEIALAQDHADGSLSSTLLALDGQSFIGSLVADEATYAFSGVFAAGDLGVDPKAIGKATVSMPVSTPVPTYA